MTLKDDTIQINLHNIPNPHLEHAHRSRGPREHRLGDRPVSPRGPIARNGATVAVGNALLKYITDARTIAGGRLPHHRQQAEAQAALAAN